MTDQWLCPHCGAKILSPDEHCSGSFLDRSHPPNVAPTLGGISSEHNAELGIHATKVPPSRVKKVES